MIVVDLTSGTLRNPVHSSKQVISLYYDKSKKQKTTKSALYARNNLIEAVQKFLRLIFRDISRTQLVLSFSSHKSSCGPRTVTICGVL